MCHKATVVKQERHHSEMVQLSYQEGKKAGTASTCTGAALKA